MLWKPSEPSCQARLSSALRFQSLQARWMITSWPREIRSVPSASGESIACPPGLSVIESTSIRGSAARSLARASTFSPPSEVIGPRLVTSSAATTKPPGRARASRSPATPSALATDVGCAVRVEALDRLHPPELATGALFRRPHDRLEVRVVHEVAARRDLDAVATGLEPVQEEALRDPMLRRSCLDRDAGVDEHVGSAEALLARVDPEGQVMEPAARTVVVGDVDELVGGDRETEPRALLRSVVQLDALVQAVPQELLREHPARPDVGRQDVDVVEAFHGRAAADVPLRLVLPRRPKMLGSLVALRLVQQLE